MNLKSRTGATAIALALGALLAGCNKAPEASSDATVETTASGRTLGEASVASEPSLASTQSASATPVHDPAATAAAAQTPVSCTASIGEVRAAQLVRQCIRLSPATHPPCNAANSCAIIEDEIARSCALLGADAKGEAACDPTPTSAAAAVATIRRYYDAINAHDYGTAFGTWGDDGANSGKSFDAFRNGFARTRATHVEVGTPGRVEGAAGSLYVTVPVKVDAQLDNGTSQHFTGQYVLRQSSGAGAPSQGWHLYSAKLKPT